MKIPLRDLFNLVLVYNENCPKQGKTTGLFWSFFDHYPNKLELNEENLSKLFSIVASYILYLKTKIKLLKAFCFEYCIPK